ncbi:hypothetical protein B0H19DRAFT_1273372 [Mycena capillaripes]|nr:hypothetical protein B0H19DRAFT_1273372 [Mycena capillaripes]
MPAASSAEDSEGSSTDRVRREASVQMASFPPEILCKIFLAAIPHPNNRDGLPAHFSLAISHVCRHWRRTALSFQKLWAFLDVEQPAKEAACVAETSPLYDLMYSYMERSGDQALTLRLAYACGGEDGDEDESYEETEGVTPYHSFFFEWLSLHSAARWENIHLESLILSSDEIFGEDDDGKYPNLRSLTLSYSQFGSDDTSVACLEGVPWSQLTRYHEYECSWRPDDTRFWDILGRLTNVVDLRAGFVSVSGLDHAVHLPQLRFASIEIRRHVLRLEEFTIDELLEDFDLPRLEGLNLKLQKDHPPDVLYPVADELRALKTLRLCGPVKISKATLKHMLTAIPTLTDFSVEMEGISARDLFLLLNPGSKYSTLVPNLQALRITQFENCSGAFEALLDMLRVRFRGIPTRGDFSPLRLFSFFTRLHTTPSLILDGLRSLKQRGGWDIRIDDDWRGDFWKEDMAEACLQ